jgi:hypothetical protein
MQPAPGDSSAKPSVRPACEMDDGATVARESVECAKCKSTVNVWRPRGLLRCRRCTTSDTRAQGDPALHRHSLHPAHCLTQRTSCVDIQPVQGELAQRPGCTNSAQRQRQHRQQVALQNQFSLCVLYDACTRVMLCGQMFAAVCVADAGQRSGGRRQVPQLASHCHCWGFRQFACSFAPHNPYGIYQASHDCASHCMHYHSAPG